MLGAGSGAVVTGKTELLRHLEPSFLNCCLVLLCLPTFLAHESNKASCMFCTHTRTTHAQHTHQKNSYTEMGVAECCQKSETAEG